MKKRTKSRCECSDRLCPEHEGSVCNKAARVRMKRVDMEDWTGVKFCFACGYDAAESGVFGPAQPLHFRLRKHRGLLYLERRWRKLRNR